MILRYIFARLILLVPILIGVSLIVFLAIKSLPGDPAIVMLGERASAEAVKQLRERMGLDRPLAVQYLLYLKGLAMGDLGRSIVTNNSVVSELSHKFPATVELSLAAMAIALFFGVGLGIWSAVRKDSWIDDLTRFLSLTGVSMPIFWLGLLLMMIFAATLNWLPFTGRQDIASDMEPITNFYLLDALLRGNWEAFTDVVRHLILPAVTLATVPLAVIARLTRSAFLEVLHQDYIRMARAKGMGQWDVVFKHALKNAAIPITTVAGLQFGLLLSGAILTERIFAWPGIGNLSVDAVFQRDFPVLQGCVLLFSLTFVGLNLLVDLLYFLIDPRLRTQH